MNITITGATGFIGSNLAVALQRDGHSVRCVSLTNWVQDGLPSQIGSPCDVFIHCAWGGVAAEARNDVLLQYANQRLFSLLMDRMRTIKPKVFISFGSQAEIYSPDSPYGTAKRGCFTQLLRLSQASDIRCLWLRLFSLYGPGESRNWFMPAMIGKLLADESIEATPGEQEMDYLHISDLVEAIRLCIANDRATGLYDVGTGHPVRLRDVLELLKELTGSNSELRFGAKPYRPDQVMRACAQPSGFMVETGWHPKTEFRTGVKQLIEHIKSHG